MGRRIQWLFRIQNTPEGSTSRTAFWLGEGRRLERCNKGIPLRSQWIRGLMKTLEGLLPYPSLKLQS